MMRPTTTRVASGLFVALCALAGCDDHAERDREAADSAVGVDGADGAESDGGAGARGDGGSSRDAAGADGRAPQTDGATIDGALDSPARPAGDAGVQGRGDGAAHDIPAHDGTVHDGAAHDAAANGSGSDDAGPRDGALPAPSGRACEGNRWLNSELDLAAIADCTSISGNLSVTGDLADIELARLTVLDGFLTVWSNAKLRRVSFPVLSRVGGYVDVSANEALTSIALPALRSANDRRVNSVWDVAIKDNAALPLCQAQAVREQLLAHGYRGTISVSPNGSPCAP